MPRGAGWPTTDTGTCFSPALIHLGDQFGHRCRLAPTLELPVTGVEERHDAFRLAPVGPPVERDIGCCGGEIHLGVETASCLGVAVLVVRPDLPHAGEIGDRPVPRHDRVRLPRLDAVEGPEKVRDRARPQDWMPLHEENVAGEHRGAVGDVDQHVATGVCWADLDEVDDGVTDGSIRCPAERRRRFGSMHAAEVEAPETVLEELADHALRRCGFLLPDHLRRVLPGLFLGGVHRREDLRPVEQFVAVAVVTVAVGIDQRRDRDAGERRLEAVEHRLRQRHVVERVDQ